MGRNRRKAGFRYRNKRTFPKSKSSHILIDTILSGLINYVVRDLKKENSLLKTTAKKLLTKPKKIGQKVIINSTCEVIENSNRSENESSDINRK